MPGPNSRSWIKMSFSRRAGSVVDVLPYSTKFSLDKSFAQCSCFVLAQKFRQI